MSVGQRESDVGQRESDAGQRESDVGQRESDAGQRESDAGQRENDVKQVLDKLDPLVKAVVLETIGAVTPSRVIVVVRNIGYVLSLLVVMGWNQWWGVGDKLTILSTEMRENVNKLGEEVEDLQRTLADVQARQQAMGKRQEEIDDRSEKINNSVSMILGRLGINVIENGQIIGGEKKP